MAQSKSFMKLVWPANMCSNRLNSFLTLVRTEHIVIPGVIT